MQTANLLKIDSITDGWRDKDHLLLHACLSRIILDISILDMPASWQIKIPFNPESEIQDSIVTCYCLCKP